MQNNTCTCNNNEGWIDCPLHRSKESWEIELEKIENRKQIPHPIIEGVFYSLPDNPYQNIVNTLLEEPFNEFYTDAENKLKEEFKKSLDFNYWYKKYYLPLQHTSEFCFDCEDGSLF